MVNGVFQPEELRLFRCIFDETVGDLPAQMRTPVNRAHIAKQILDCAATGERNPMELRMAAIAPRLKAGQLSGVEARSAQ